MIVIDTPLIFPMGHYLGPDHRSADAESDPHQVRIGWDIYPLGGERQLAVWTLAHGLPEGAGMAPWTRTATEGAARANGIPDAASILDELAAKDLVIEVAPASAEAVEFAEFCRIRAMLTGLGETDEDPPRYGIGPAAGKPLVQVPAFIYELWRWGHLCDSLRAAAAMLARAGYVDPDDALSRCLAATQVLLAHDAAYLDEAREN